MHSLKRSLIQLKKFFLKKWVFFPYIPAKEQDTTHKKPSELLYVCRLLGLCHPSNVDTDAWPLSPFIQFSLLFQPNFSNSTTPNPAKTSWWNKEMHSRLHGYTISKPCSPAATTNQLSWVPIPADTNLPSGQWKRQGEKNHAMATHQSNFTQEIGNGHSRF